MAQKTFHRVALVIVTIALFIAVPSSAQVIDLIIQFGTQANESARDLVIDEIGDLYVVGGTGGAFLGHTTPPGRDAFIRKYGANGNEIWTRQFGDSSFDDAFAVDVDIGSVYMVGRTRRPNPGFPSEEQTDAYIRKYDANGNEIWTRLIGDIGFDIAQAVKTDGNGVVYVGGVTGGLSENSLTNYRDAFISKYDSNGNELWAQQFGGNNIYAVEMIYGIAVDTDGNVIVAGDITQGAFPGQVAQGNNDAFIRKYDTYGNELWTRQFGSAGPDRLEDAVADTSGNVYVVGHVPLAIPGQISSGAFDAYVRKYDVNGNVVWTRQFGSPDYDAAFSVALDSDENVYVSGRTYAALPGQTSDGPYVRKYDAAGNEIWTHQENLGNTYRTSAIDVAGNVYVAGYTTEVLPGQTSAGGDYDAFILRFAQNQPPVAIAGGPYSTEEGSAVSLNGSGSSDPDGDTLSFYWDLDKNGTFETSGVIATFDASVHDGPSTHSVNLQVCDPSGDCATDSAVVEVENVPPSATFSAMHGTIDEGEASTLLFNNQSDPGADDSLAGFLYSYDCTNDGVFEFLDSTFTSLNCFYPENGLYVIWGRIKDKDGGYNEYTVDINVNNVAPTVNAGADQTVFEDTAVNLDQAAFNDPGILDTHTATVDWGDGNVEEGFVDQGAGAVSGSHVYDDPGNYTVTVTVEDGDTGVGNDSLTVSVVNGFLRHCVYANEDVIQIELNAYINCSVGGENLIRLKQNASVMGDVVSRTDINIEENAYVGGDAIAVGSIELEDGATVVGQLDENSNVPSFSQVGVTVSAGGLRVTVGISNNLALLPGSYSQLTVKKGGTLQLSSGHYAFDNIVMEISATLEIDLAGDYIVIDVKNTVDMKEGVTVATGSGGAADILWRVEGNAVKLGKDGEFLGTFIAPNAHIDMHAGASLTGAFYGKKVQVKLNTSVAAEPALNAFIDLFVS